MSGLHLPPVMMEWTTDVSRAVVLAPLALRRLAETRRVWNEERVPCNYLQSFENTFDEVHVAFTHAPGGSHAKLSQDLPIITCEETAWGMLRYGRRKTGLVRQTLHYAPNVTRVIVPPLTNQYLNLTKNSSLAVFIGYPDLVQVFAGTVYGDVGHGATLAQAGARRQARAMRERKRGRPEDRPLSSPRMMRDACAPPRCCIVSIAENKAFLRAAIERTRNENAHSGARKCLDSFRPCP